MNICISKHFIKTKATKYHYNDILNVLKQFFVVNWSVLAPISLFFLYYKQMNCSNVIHIKAGILKA
jgi:hypothetical protein